MSALMISGLNKAFGGLRVTRNLSLNVEPGERRLIIGPNGAGKTTLFNLITGQLVPDRGEVVWLGNSIVGLPHWKIARLGIGRTFQDLKLFTHMTVEENITTVTERGSWLWQPGGTAARTARRTTIEKVIEATGLKDKRRARAIDLSFAERKFLSLARVMASGARLWLLDEPASGLDPGSYERFLSLLRQEVREGVTICIIEHNLDIVQGISDRIAFLDQGRLLAEGEPKTILSDPALAAIYFGERAA